MMAVSETILFTNAKANFDKGFPFVLYRKPDSAKVIGIFQQNGQMNLVRDFSETGYVFAPFNGNRIFIIPDIGSEVVSSEIGGTAAAVDQIGFPEPEADKQPHLALVQKAIEAIENQEFSKVVVARKEVVRLEDFELEPAFKALLGSYPTAFTYCWFHPETGLWLGAFSEQLLKLTGDGLHTMSVAGTQEWHDGAVTWREKEQEEQRIVTRFIVENLQSFSDDISVSAPYTLKAGNLCHIKTDIKAKLNAGAKPADIISVLHPTPAVCGMPKEQARKFILENETCDREYYSGFHGELNKDFLTGARQTDLFVNLRCMKIENNNANLFTGGGITRDSIPEKEWTETVNKAQTMKKVLTQNKTV